MEKNETEMTKYSPVRYNAVQYIKILHMPLW